MGKRSDRSGYWSHIMLEQSASRLSIRAFCAKRKISLYQFYSWHRRLRELLPDQWQPLPKDEHGLIISDRS